MSVATGSGWAFFKIALIVTGKGEEAFLPNLFKALVAEGHCVFKVTDRVGQLSQITSKPRVAKMVGKGSFLTTRDQDIGLYARRCLQHSRFDFVILVDDLEHARREHAAAIYGRYRRALDVMLDRPGLRAKASVHFLVNMLEAYFFADPAAINAALATDLAEPIGDVEDIRHPKGELGRIHPGYDEIDHGRKIVQSLDLRHVLSRPETCPSLRTLVGWCSKAIGRTHDEVYQLAFGVYSPLTGPQIGDLP